MDPDKTAWMSALSYGVVSVAMSFANKFMIGEMGSLILLAGQMIFTVFLLKGEHTRTRARNRQLAAR